MSDLANGQSIDTEHSPKKNEPIYTQTSEMKIGNTTYIIKTHFNKNARENAEQKFLRVVNNRIAQAINNPETQQNSGEMAESST